MYHGISANEPGRLPDDRETGAHLYDVSLDNFVTQMNWLKEQGFEPTLYENTAALMGPKPVIITFDDGEMNNHKQALPVLKSMGWKAYFFIIIKRVGRDGYMGWKELKELHEAGMVIGSHGLSHEILTNLLDSQMEEELRASKKNLEKNLGISIDALSIPRGFCNEKIIETAYGLGYKTIFISEPQAWLKSGCISRIAVKSHWNLARFDLAMHGKTPFLERTGDAVKRTLKILLRENGYNGLRSLFIKLIQ